MRYTSCLSRSKRELTSLAFWRDILAEFMATFMLVSVQCALPLTWGGQYGGPVQTGVGMGMIVGAMAHTLGDFGGGHMNPAVTFSMLLLFKITVFRAIFYMIAQCLGGICGAAYIFGAIPAAQREGLANTDLGEGVKQWQGFLIEMWITTILVTTILGSTNARRKGQLFMPGIMIAFAIALGIMSGFGSTGGSMNPARSLGPAVVMWAWYDNDKDGYEANTNLDTKRLWSNHWVYWVGPLAGAAIAAIVYTLFDMVDFRKQDEEMEERNTKI